MKLTYIFDTIGTTIPMSNIDTLNREFFTRGTQIGYTSDQIASYRAMFETDPKDPKFLKGSADGKIRLLDKGLVVMEFYADVEPTLQRIIQEGRSTRIFTKGAQELVIKMYEQGGLGRFVAAGDLTSSTDFTISDKTNPACYEGLQDHMKGLGETLLLYVSDEVGEVNACQEALSVDIFYIDRGQKRKGDLANRVREIKDLREIF